MGWSRDMVLPNTDPSCADPHREGSHKSGLSPGRAEGLCSTSGAPTSEICTGETSPHNVWLTKWTGPMSKGPKASARGGRGRSPETEILARTLFAFYLSPAGTGRHVPFNHMHLLPYWSHRVCSVLASSPLPCWNWWARADITLSRGITEASGFVQPRHSGVGGHAPPPCSPFASLKLEGAPGPHRKCLLISWPCPGGQGGWHSWSPWTRKDNSWQAIAP